MFWRGGINIKLGDEALYNANLQQVVCWRSLSWCPLLQVSTQPEIADDPCKDVKYKEATVDSMRAQKDEVCNYYNNRDTELREVSESFIIQIGVYDNV